MADPAPPERSQSTTSLAKLYHGASANGSVPPHDELSDPSLDFCNAFWGSGDRGYEVIMARLRGAARTVEELRVFWKERAAIEEDYARRLAKLAKMPVGRDEVGDLAASLQSVQTETASQASYHLQLSGEIHQTVEQPTAELGNRLAGLKKGLQASVEKSYRNKGLQEGHVAKARERYESDCLKLNSYTANMQLVQGKELEKLHMKIDKVRQTITQNERDFHDFVSVLEQTSQKWENEWRSFCDHVQDFEEDRMMQTKDIVWAYANAVSQVCVEDDGSCERVRERLEQFEPANDMTNFVRGWGTGDQIPDPPRFINYSKGEYPQQPTFRNAAFRRLSARPPLPPPTRQSVTDEPDADGPAAPMAETEQSPAPNQAPLAEPSNPPVPDKESSAPPADELQRLQMDDEPANPPDAVRKPPPGGVALSGLTANSSQSMGPPPVPASLVSRDPPSPSARDIADDRDPMSIALDHLRRNPPGPEIVRRAGSQRRADSLYSNTGSVRPSQASNHQDPRAPSPAPSANPQRESYPSQPGRSSLEKSLVPPAAGHTASALAQSMADFRNPSRNSVNYSAHADSVVGQHPSSRPSSPSPSNRAPSPAMMQPPQQPATHIADDVLSRYGQKFPNERAPSRPASMYSNRSRAGSMIEQPAPQSTGTPRDGFAGIGAGNAAADARSKSPGPGARAPSPNPGVLGPHNVGIELDENGGVARDTMAESYRRQYEQERARQQQPPQHRQTPSYGGYQPPQQPQQPQPAGYQTTVPPPTASTTTSFQPGHQQQPSVGYPQPQGPYHPAQAFGPPSPRPPQQQPPQQQPQYPQYPQQPQQPAQQQQQQPPYSPYGDQQVSGYRQQSVSSPGYGYDQQARQQQPAAHQEQPTTQPYGYPNGHSQPPQQQQQQHQPAYRAPSPSPGYGGPSPQPGVQQHQPYPSSSPQPPSQQPYATPSPQPQQYDPARPGAPVQRTPSPRPGVAPTNAQPTGQWSASGEPVLFYVQALYDYTAQSQIEFDFQQGDIIAVTSTPEDGWWSGELLDEARRVPGRTDFPSNFVSLF